MAKDPREAPSGVRKPKVWPAYLAWRDGKPRWIPGPALRAKGHAGQDMKDPKTGAWLRKGDAIEAAEKINAAIAQGASAAALAASQRPRGARTLDALFEAYKASGDFKKLKPKTQRGYRSHMDMLSAWAGDVLVHAITRAAIKEFHSQLTEGRGLATANAVLRTLKLTLYVAMNDLEWIDRNKTSRLKRPMPKGRLVMWTPQEIAACVAAADWLGKEAIGDAVLQGVLSGQREGDLLDAPDWQLANGVYVFVQNKTGRSAFVPPTEPLTARLAKMAERKVARWPNVAFAHSIVDETGRAYDGEGTRFRHDFAMVRAVASGAVFALADFFRSWGGLPPLLRNLPFTPQPTILGKNFQDLRDTAVTWLCDAGCDVGRIATITGHSLKTVQEILDKHYFVRHAGMAISAGKLYDALLARNNIGG